MTLDEFWNTVEGLDPENAVAELTERLQKLSPSEIAAFHVHFCQAHRQAYNWSLWGAAYLIDGGCSDDSFMDFRYGLISRGRKFYESTLQNPDSLADTLSDDDFIPNEDFGYVASHVYKNKTGEDIPDPGLPRLGNPTGAEWDLDNPEWTFEDPALCAKNLPKLWRRYGESA
jgi:hypothetical protein